MLVACGSSPQSSPARATTPPSTISATEVTRPAQTAPLGTFALGATWRRDGVLLRGAADLDEDGRPETIELISPTARPDFAGSETDESFRIHVPVVRCDPPRERCPARLVVAGATLYVDIPAGYFGGLGVEVIDIDRSDRRKELLLTQRGDNDEDPWYEFRVLIRAGTRLHLRELWHSSGYNSGTAVARGDGTLTLRYDECPDTTTVTYGLDGTELVETGRQVLRTRDPSTCAACPYVYVLEGDRFVRQGEILRNLNHESLAATQSLALRAAPAGVVTVELREEKDETTYLDHVYLEVDGVLVPPRECDAGSARYCGPGGGHHVLRQGEALRLTFATGESGGRSVRLWATGYYLPTS